MKLKTKNEVWENKLLYDNFAFSFWLTFIFSWILSFFFVADLDYWIYQYTSNEFILHSIFLIVFFLFCHLFLIKILQKNYYNNFYWKNNYKIVEQIPSKWLLLVLALMTILIVLSTLISASYFSKFAPDFIFTQSYRKIHQFQREENNWDYFHQIYNNNWISVLIKTWKDQKYEEAFLSLLCIKSWLENNEIKIEENKVYLNVFECEKYESSQKTIEENILKLFVDSEKTSYDIEVKEFTTWKNYYWKIQMNKKNSN